MQGRSQKFVMGRYKSLILMFNYRFSAIFTPQKFTWTDSGRVYIPYITPCYYALWAQAEPGCNHLSLLTMVTTVCGAMSLRPMVLYRLVLFDTFHSGKSCTFLSTLCGLNWDVFCDNIYTCLFYDMKFWFNVNSVPLIVWILRHWSMLT